MMYEHLVKNLRDDTALQNCEFDFVHAWMHEAADAIEELQKITAHYEEESKGWWLAACDAKEERERLKEQLDNAEIENIKLREEFAKYRGKNRWIPVTERLPEAGKKVLVFAYGYDTITARMCKKTEDGYPVFECKGYDGIYREMARAGRISHWMPLPEKPEVM